MERQIPIIVTRQSQKHGQFSFKFASPHLAERLKSINRNLNPSGERQTSKGKRTKTVDRRDGEGIVRTRRISSSAAAKRFPKDFFKKDMPLQPVFLKQGKKLQNSNLLDTFSQKYFPPCQPHQNTSKETFNSEGTPQFQSKKVGVRVIRANLSNEQNTGNITEFQAQYCSLKQQSSQIKQPQSQPIQTIKFAEMAEITSKFANFNVTLGQKISTALIFRKQKQRRRMEIRQKENKVAEVFGLKGMMLRPEGGFRIRRKI